MVLRFVGNNQTGQRENQESVTTSTMTLWSVSPAYIKSDEDDQQTSGLLTFGN